LSTWSSLVAVVVEVVDSTLLLVLVVLAVTDQVLSVSIRVAVLLPNPKLR
jgi:hypothetical protein